MYNYYLMTFPSSHQAFRFEDLLKERDFNIKLIPVPREISSSCGVSARIINIKLQELKKICFDYNLEFNHIYGGKEDEGKLIRLV